MNKIIFFLTLFYISLLLVVSDAASQNQSSIPVGLEEATHIAMNRRLEIQIDSEKKIMAQLKVKKQKGNFLPTIDLQGLTEYTENFDEFTDIQITYQYEDEEIPVNIINQVPEYQIEAQLELNYNLFSGGRHKALLDAAVSSLESARHQKALTKRKIQLEVADAYWELKKAQVAHAIEKRNNDVVELEVKVAQTKFKVNRKSAVEYDAVLLKREENLVALKKAERDRLSTLRNYLFVLGILHDGLSLTSVLIPELVDDPNIETSSVESSSVHPEILRLRSDLRAAAEQVQVEKSASYPNIDFFGEYGFIGRENDASYIETLEDVKATHYTIGLKVSMNLFNGQRTMAQIALAKARVRKHKLDLNLKERQLENIRSAKQKALDMANDELLLAIARKKLEDARLKAAKTQFQLNRTSKLEYRQIVVGAENATGKVMIARIDVALARNERELLVFE